MHDVGQQTCDALQEMFPEVQLGVGELNSGATLVLGAVLGDTRLAIHTPPTLDYRRYDYREWVHRAAPLLREKLP